MSYQNHSPNATLDISRTENITPEQSIAPSMSFNMSAHSYYRSKLFTVQHGINHLIAAASPLLSIHARLKTTSYEPDMAQLHQHLVHELNSFATIIQNRGYRNESILVARYLLCALLDETILTASWSKKSYWENQRLLMVFQGEVNADERFFFILERLSKEPDQHLELLELSYLCLNQGFEGKYRHENNGKIKLHEMMDMIYQLIRIHKTDPLPLLTPFQVPIRNEGKNDDGLIKEKTKHQRFKRFCLFGIMVVIFALGTGVWLKYTQSNKAENSLAKSI